MKINDNAVDPRFDLRAPATATQPKPSVEGNATNPNNLPSVIDRPATIIDVRGGELTNPDAEQRRAGNDPDADRRREIARSIIGQDVDVRAMTPREASDVGLQLYAEGLVTWEEYAEFAFQPELHPAYNQTIGALLGETATPDQPQDFVQEWADRLAYEQRYNAIDSADVKSTQKIAVLLSRLAGQTTRVDV